MYACTCSHTNTRYICTFAHLYGLVRYVLYWYRYRVSCTRVNSLHPPHLVYILFSFPDYRLCIVLVSMGGRAPTICTSVAPVHPKLLFCRLSNRTIVAPDVTSAANRAGYYLGTSLEAKERVHASLLLQCACCASCCWRCCCHLFRTACGMTLSRGLCVLDPRWHQHPV